MDNVYIILLGAAGLAFVYVSALMVWDAIKRLGGNFETKKYDSFNVETFEDENQRLLVNSNVEIDKTKITSTKTKKTVNTFIWVVQIITWFLLSIALVAMIINGKATLLGYILVATWVIYLVPFLIEGYNNSDKYGVKIVLSDSQFKKNTVLLILPDKAKTLELDRLLNKTKNKM